MFNFFGFPFSVLLALIFVTANLAQQALVCGEEGPLRHYVDLQHDWTIEVIAGSGGDIGICKKIPIEIGREWEGVLGERFDGRAIYRTTLHQKLPRSEFQQWWLEVDGAATAAIVRIDGVEVGRHLGGWTPFRCDITAFVKKQSTDYQPLIEIELDELVGHNTQGFLPIVVPHFGGIWKSVRLVGQKTDVSLDDVALRVGGYRGEEQLEFEVPVILPENRSHTDYQIDFRINNGTENDLKWRTVDWNSSQTRAKVGQEKFVSCLAAGIYQPELKKRWSPAEPFLYELEFRLSEKSSGKVVDGWTTKAAIRDVRAEGRRLLLNGETLAVRGLLNWGYAPPRLSPTLDEKWIRDELQQAKHRGFNLMKICLWIPPKRYLELADEMGMLIWLEYPTWHPDFSENKLLDLKQEFREFFHYDRNHPSVVVRSLTCETGPGADIKVIQELYDLAHREVPGAVVEDDSSWIQWNRVSDFYDDHPYGNNHTWRQKLDELDRYISEREAKPLLLGEAIAADTWANENEVAAAGAAGDTVHAPLSIGTLGDYVKKLGTITEWSEIEALPSTSRRYAWLMRKFQIETYRDRFPDQGYVVSVIRDFPLASMGLVDRSNQWKWTPGEFAWHRDAMLVLRTPHDRRSFVAQEKLALEIVLVGGSKEHTGASLQWNLQNVGSAEVLVEGTTRLQSDTAGRSIGSVALTFPEVIKPQCVRLSATVDADGEHIVNNWDLWVTPKPDNEVVRLHIHSSAQSWCDSLSGSKLDFQAWDGSVNDCVVLTRRWDRPLWDAALRGTRVVMLPDNSAGSLATREHWFLRGGPIAGSIHRFWNIYPREMYRDLQHFDWSGPVMFDSPLTQQVTPIALLWDNHDLKLYRSHLLAFDCRVGEGRWLASTLGLGNKTDGGNVELLRAYVDSIKDDSLPVKSLNAEWMEAIESEIGSKAVSLAKAAWVFSPDAREVGVREKWFSGLHDRTTWKPITIDRHWEAQGYSELDGWGWYFAEVEIPEELQSPSTEVTESPPLYVHFTGADDYFELYIDGEMIGSGGDRELRQTAFELRKSFPVSHEASRDGKLAVAVRILDWQGAGGLFRPIYLSNRPIRETAAVLVEAQ